MSEESEPTPQPKRQRRWRWLALTAVVVALAAFALFYLIPNYQALTAFRPLSGQALAAALAEQPQHADRQTGRLLAALPKQHIDVALYRLYLGSRGRPLFFERWQPKPAANALLQRIDDLRYDGIDPAQLGIAQRRESLTRLEQRYSELAGAAQFDPPAWERLRICLVLGRLGALSPDELAQRIVKLIDTPQQQSYPDSAAKLQQLGAGLDELLGDAAELDVTLAQDFRRLAAAMGLPRSRIAPLLLIAPSDISAALAELEPNMPDYQGLRRALRFYAGLKAQGGLPQLVLPGRRTKLKLGDSGELVQQLKQRLTAEEFYTGPIDDQFDAGLEQALKVYQEHHQLTVDGVAAESTFAALNVPLDERVAALILALDKLRRTTCRWEEFYFRVNIPEFEVHVIRDGQVVRNHRIVVGNRLAKNHTPEFIDEIEFVEFNPFWNVPERIVGELVADAQGAEDQQAWFSRRGYRVSSSASGRMHITQSPGAGNALGRVKILFPNRHDVYLHDTPSKSLFERPVRAFSHGCMRLHNALDMAKWLLEQDGHPDAARADQILQSGANRRLALQHKIPIHIEYVAMGLHADGKAVFLSDIYGRDQEKLRSIINQIGSKPQLF